MPLLFSGGEPGMGIALKRHMWLRTLTAGTFVGSLFLACGGPTNSGASCSGSSGATPSSPPPDHRAAAAACPAQRPPSNTANSDAIDGSRVQCNSDADCTAGFNGRCLAAGHNQPADGWACSYDTCSTDSDCGRGQLCSCRGPSPDIGTNSCLPSNCLVDADCGPGGYCSPSLDAGCGSFVGVTGWYCHKPCDECVRDADCPVPDSGHYDQTFCGYKPDVGKWACISTGCVE